MIRTRLNVDKRKFYFFFSACFAARFLADPVVGGVWRNGRLAHPCANNGRQRRIRPGCDFAAYQHANGRAANGHAANSDT